MPEILHWHDINVLHICTSLRVNVIKFHTFVNVVLELSVVTLTGVMFPTIMQ